MELQVESVQLDENGNCIRETSIENLISPGSPDINNVFGEPLLKTRVGDEYQVDIPSLLTESQHSKLLDNPIDSDNVDISHSFLIGLPIPITWLPDEVNNTEDGGSGSLRNSDDAVDGNRSVEARSGKKDHARSRKKSSERNVKSVGVALDNKGASREDNPEPKSYYPVPGFSTDPWTDSEVDGFILGLHIFGKNFIQIKRFLGNKGRGEILSFYYGKFYRSDAYRSWSDGRKLKRRKNVTGRKIFTGWRQRELLSRLSSHIPEESQNMLLEVYKPFSEGRISLEEYVSSLKSIVSIPILVEAVGIGKGKEDLTSFAMEPAKGSHDLLVCPSGQACSSLTSSDIVKFLTRGIRLSKARCNDIFWEAVWPRLLARGWHSEQPKNQGYVSSKHYLVFLVPGIQKFSRRRLVKGEHYFDCVSDVLNKVASEPKLLELETEESPVGRQNEQDTWSPELGSDQDDPSDSQRHCYLKPRVSTSNSSHLKFTVVDTSLVFGGKSSSVIELRHLPIEVEITSKQIGYSREDEGDASEDDLDDFETVEKPFLHEKAKYHKGISDGGDANGVKFTVVDTSLDHGGKSSKMRELRYPPVVIKRESEFAGLLRKTVISKDSSGKRERDAIDIPSKGKRKTKIHRANCDKDMCDTATKDQMAKANSSDTVNKMESQHDENTGKSREKNLKRTQPQQASRRAKSGHSDFSPLMKRRRLSACAKVKPTQLTQSCSQGLRPKQMEVHGITKLPETDKNVISQVPPQEKVSSTTCLADSSPTKDISSEPLRGNCFAMNMSGGRNQKHQNEALNNRNPSQGKQNSRNSEMLIEEVEVSQTMNVDGYCLSSKEKKPVRDASRTSSDEKKHVPETLRTSSDEKKLVPETLRTSSDEKKLVPETLRISSDVNTSEELHTTNQRRQSTRNRPLTAKALEALANGYLHAPRKQKSTESILGEDPFSNACRKARSRVKSTSSHGNLVASKQDKEMSGACNVERQKVSKSLEQIEENGSLAARDVQSYLSS
ncbi:hypothetical protein UlMin_029220 [Ulmus minor]